MIRAVVALLLLVATAHAEDVPLPRTKAKLTIPDGWTRLAVPGIVAGYKAPGGVLLAVTRAPVPNPDAWRTKKRDAYVDQIERGVASSMKGYKRLAKKLSEVAGVPALDLEARRDDGATIVLRVLLFRTYALALAIEVPKGGEVAPMRKLATSFAPSVKHTSDTP